jgi:hypothetical protein
MTLDLARNPTVGFRCIRTRTSQGRSAAYDRHLKSIHPHSVEPLGGRGLPPDRRGQGLTRAPCPPRHARRRSAAPQRDREARTLSHSGEPGRSPAAGRTQDPARDRRARRGACAAPGRRGLRAEAAGRPFCAARAGNDVRGARSACGRRAASGMGGFGSFERGWHPRDGACDRDSADTRGESHDGPRDTSGELEARRFGRTRSPRKSVSESDTTSSARGVPAAVKRAADERDGGRCRYVDAHGDRCTARGWLELHQRHPRALGGDHSPDNLASLCRVHHRLISEVDLGKMDLGQHRRTGAAPPARPA